MIKNNEIPNVKLTASQILRDFSMDLYGLRTDEMVFIAGRGFTISNEQITWNDNQLDLWNDSVSILDKNYFRSDIGTVDASEWGVKNPMVKEGTAFVLTGLTKLTLGLHRGLEAFIQVGDVRVRRDTNRNGIWEESQIHLASGINLHAAYTIRSKNKIEIVGSNSLGCTVPKLLWQDPIWIQHYVQRAKNTKQKFFYRLYVDGRELALYIGAKYAPVENKNFANILYEERQRNKIA